VNLHFEKIGRFIRGFIGVILAAAGYIDGSWFGIIGIFLIFSAVTGKCGFGTLGCEIKPVNKENNL